jgi:hypothetical protein
MRSRLDGAAKQVMVELVEAVSAQGRGDLKADKNMIFPGRDEMSQAHISAPAVAMVAVLCGVAAPAAGQPGEPPASGANDQWHVTVAPYVWATSLDGNATVHGIKSDVDVPFSDILKDLSLAAMLLVDVGKDRFGIGVNGVFARVSPDNEVGGVKIKTTSDTVQLGVAPYYRLVDWTWRVSASGQPLRLTIAPEAGFRFTYLRAELDVRHGGPSVDQNESWVDPLIGSRFGLDLSDHWTIASEADVGGFGVGSDFAWNAQAFLGYKTTLFGRPTTFAAGYRALSQDYDHNNFKWDVTMHGPIIGAAMRF